MNKIFYTGAVTLCATAYPVGDLDGIETTISRMVLKECKFEQFEQSEILIGPIDWSTSRNFWEDSSLTTPFRAPVGLVAGSVGR